MMNTSYTRTQLLAAVVVLAASSAIAGYLFGTHTQTAAPPAIADARATHDRQVLYWYDPMVPQQHFERPGKSPFMDMALVPRYADAAGAQPAVRIDAQTSQQLGMREVNVERSVLAAQIDATGTIELDAHAVATVQARSNGFVERVWPIAAGDSVAKGAPLVALRLPEWKGSAEEWLIVSANADAAMRAAATERLRQLGMPALDMQALAHSRHAAAVYTIAAPIGGVVQDVAVRAGMVVSTGQTLVTLNGMQKVWLFAAVPEASSAALRVGNRVRALLPAMPGRVIAGRVDAVLPVLDPATRTVRVRIELANSDGALRPGLTAQVQIAATVGEPTLSVPTEAVIRTGQRTLVMLAQGSGRYRPVAIQTGREMGERTEVLAGVTEGQRIVASGQFLLDSEASVLGIAPAPAPAPDSAPAPAPERAAAPTLAVHEADARIVAIDGARITLAHGPFRTLNMGGMTMTFALQAAGLGSAMHAGDRVRVGVVQTANGLTVVRLTRAQEAR